MPKVCIKCKVEKPTVKYFRLAVNGSGHRDECIECEAGTKIPKKREVKVDLTDAPLAKLLEVRKAENKAAAKAVTDRARGKRLAQKKIDSMDEDERKRKEAAAEQSVLKEQARTRIANQKRAKKVKEADDDAQRELANRVLTRKSLLAYIRRFHGDYDAGWVHKLICKKLERFMKDIEDKKDPRLMIFMPPRSGKSTIASQYYPSWVLGQHPNWEIIAASYAVSLPLEFSRKNRALVRDTGFKQVFPGAKLDSENQSADGWKTTEGGGYLPSGTSGGITGKGAHLLVIDDPFKDHEEADSETTRESRWQWWDSTAKTRLSPGGGVLIFHTRWNDDDLAGRLIHQEKEQTEEMETLLFEAHDTLNRVTENGSKRDIQSALANVARMEEEQAAIDHWDILSFPALAEEPEYLTKQGKIVTEPEPDAIQLREVGDALHPTRFSRTRLLNRKKGMMPRYWNALYQQNPVPDEGEYHQKAWFRYEHDPTHQSRLWKGWDIRAAWDLAIGKKDRNDYTVGLVGGMDPDGRIHLLDIRRGRMGSKEIATAILDVASQWNVGLTGIEEGQIKLAIMPYLKDMMHKRRFSPSFTEGKQALRPVTDKEARGRVAQGMLQNGRVILPLVTQAPWVEVFTHELLRFPAGLHDDQCDAFFWLMRMFVGVTPPRPKKAKGSKSWKDKVKDTMRGRDGFANPMSA